MSVMNEAPSSRPSLVNRFAFVPVLFATGVAFLAGQWFGKQVTVHGPAPSTHDAAAEGDDHADHDHASDSKTYICPMHPQVRQDEFGTCPICFMDLVELEGGADADPDVVPSTPALERAGVRTERVVRTPLTTTLRTWGQVAASERDEGRVASLIAGRVERFEIDAVGASVRRGQRVARIWSPEVGAASEALVTALEVRDAAMESRRALHDDVVSSARTRLRALGLADDDIARIERTRVPEEHVTIRATSGGRVVERPVRAGDWVERGATLLSLRDLREVWVQVEVPERELARVSVGTNVRVLPRGQDASVEGQVAFVDPVIDPVRRVARARIVVANGDGALRPGQWVHAEIDRVRDGRDPVTVPRSAVLWTGTRSLVYVRDATVDPPIFQPVEVVVGERNAERVEILEGVFPGEEIVAHGAFVLDASLQIRGGPSMMTRGPAARDAAGTTAGDDGRTP